MAIMFSKVTMRDDYNESEFLVGGFPQEADDLEGWTAYHEFLDEITEDTVVNVRAQAFLYGEGETELVLDLGFAMNVAQALDSLVFYWKYAEVSKEETD